MTTDNTGATVTPGTFSTTELLLFLLATVAYCLWLHYDFILDEGVYSAFLADAITAGNAGREPFLLAHQPPGVRLLLSAFADAGRSGDAIFRIAAILQFLATVLFATRLFRPDFHFAVALAGGLLLGHFTWAGSQALLPYSWLGPLFTLFAVLLVRRNGAWPLGLTLVATALLCPPLLLLQLLLLAVWFLLLCVRSLSRPKLVRSTLNLENAVRLRNWPLVWGLALLAALLAWLTHQPAPELGLSRVGYAVYLEDPEKLASLFNAVPFSFLILSVGAIVIGFYAGARPRVLGLFAVSAFTAGLLYNLFNPSVPAAWSGYGGQVYAVVVGIPLVLALLVGFVDRLVGKAWFVPVAVVLLLLWIPAYQLLV